MKISLLISTILFSIQTFAAGPTISSASGASGFEGATASTASVTVYGGLAGADCSSTLSSAGPLCSNCTTAQNDCTTTLPLCACNTARIYDDATLVLNVTPPTGVTEGEVKMVRSDATSTFIDRTGTPGLTTITFLWKTLCNQSDQNVDCGSITGKATFSGIVFIDKNSNNVKDSDEEGTTVNFVFLKPTVDEYDVYGASHDEGIGTSTQGFIPYPGDEKVYITDVDASANPPTFTYGGKAKILRVFYSDQGLANATVDAANSDITIEDDGGLGKNTVTGLTNDTSYVFRVALVDQASNVVQFFPAVGADATCDAGSPFTNCPWVATPEKVLGLLTDDINCFIATAAYGSSFEPKVQTFRKFRNRFLLPHKWGRKFVKAYYDYGPIAAKAIVGRPILRAIARGFLWPFYIFSYSSLRFGPWVTIIGLITSLAMMVGIFNTTRSRRRAT